MTTTALIVAYWFLAAPVGSSVSTAFGPYPTATICQLAEHTIDPSNQAFWTAEQHARWLQHQAAVKKLDDWEAQLVKLNPKYNVRYRLPDGTEFYIGPPNSGVGTIGWSLDFDSHGVGFVDGTIGKSVPKVPDDGDIAAPATYYILQTCQPVKGWYSTHRLEDKE